MARDDDTQARPCWVGEHIVAAAAAVVPAFTFEPGHDLGSIGFHACANMGAQRNGVKNRCYGRWSRIVNITVNKFRGMGSPVSTDIVSIKGFSPSSKNGSG